MSERTSLAQADAAPESMAREFDFAAWVKAMEGLGYMSDFVRARALGMDHAVVSRLRAAYERGGKTKPGAKFIRRTMELGIAYSEFFPPKGDR